MFFDVSASTPFPVEAPASGLVAERVMPQTDGVIGFHMVTEGSCWTEMVERRGEPVLIQAEDVVVSRPATPTSWLLAGHARRAHIGEVFRPPGTTLPFPISIQRPADSDEYKLIYGFLGCEQHPFNPLLDTVPRMFHATVSRASQHWMSGLLGVAVEASDASGPGPASTAGRKAMLAKLAELMLVEALRDHLESLPPIARGWVAGLRDAQVGATLAWSTDARQSHGPSSSWRARSACLVLRSPIGSRRVCRSLRCSTSLAGGSSSPPTCGRGTARVGDAAAAVGSRWEAAFTWASSGTRGWRRELATAPYRADRAVVRLILQSRCVLPGSASIRSRATFAHCSVSGSPGSG